MVDKNGYMLNIKRTQENCDTHIKRAYFLLLLDNVFLLHCLFCCSMHL